MTEAEAREAVAWCETFARIDGGNPNHKIMRRCVDALEKRIAKKQGNINDCDSHLKLKAGFLCCSATNKAIRYPLISLRDFDYCPRCGQKLDWNEV